MKIVFMGTPDFSAGVLESVIEAGFEVTAVVTQADKPKGRSNKPVYSPVKEVALAHQIPVFQPVKIKTEESIAQLKQFEADLYLVVAYGKMLNKEILTIPRLGSINIHASLLPKYRGAAPIQWAVLNGEQKTGVTIMQMDEGMDTGDILFTKEVELDQTETGESLFDKLCEISRSFIVEVLPKIERGEVTPVKQNEEEATHVGMLTKEMGNLDFTQPAVVLERYVRGLNSWPCAYTYYKGKNLKIWESHVEDREALGPCGTIESVTKEAICINTGEGILAVTSVQLEGKKRMSVHDFLVGNKVEAGEIFTRGIE